MNRININEGFVLGNFTYIKDIEKKELPSGQKVRQCVCKCVCGRERVVLFVHFIRNKIHSCGCLKIKRSDSQVGNKYGSLTVIKELPNLIIGDRVFRVVLAKCDCGVEKSYRLSGLKRVKSCGCMTVKIRNESMGCRGLSNMRLYHIWLGMKSRCYNKNIPSFKDYGGKGVSICSEWHEFDNFEKWSLQNGYNENLSIDRFPDVSGNYEPSNCRWANWEQQANNKRNTKKFQYKGEWLTLPDICKRYNLVKSRVLARIYLGWSLVKAIETPKMDSMENLNYKKMAKHKP